MSDPIRYAVQYRPKSYVSAEPLYYRGVLPHRPGNLDEADLFDDEETAKEMAKVRSVPLGRGLPDHLRARVVAVRGSLLRELVDGDCPLFHEPLVRHLCLYLLLPGLEGDPAAAPGIRRAASRDGSQRSAGAPAKVSGPRVGCLGAHDKKGINRPQSRFRPAGASRGPTCPRGRVLGRLSGAWHVELRPGAPGRLGVVRRPGAGG
jgi:hypothetical protein